VTTRRIFLARHGNRQDFVDPTWSSTADEPYDPPLSRDGVEQARKLGLRLASEGISAVVASPFLRTIQTAHHANAALHAPIYVEPGVGEWLSPHSFERPPVLRELALLRAEYPKLAHGYAASFVQRYPESAGEMFRRAQATLESLIEKLDGTLLVVGHAASVAAMALIDPDIDSVDCPLCALFCLEHDGARWRLSLNAEVAHAGGALAGFTFRAALGRGQRAPRA
jgi:broad specificity phosphatase PhoE